MRRLALLFAIVLAAPAQAATYWVSPTGTTTASGADSLSNAKSLAWFNSNAVAGDICRFKSGTYSTAVSPTNSGTSSARIRYYGFPRDPYAVNVAGITLNGDDYITVKWMKTSGGPEFPLGCIGDSVGRVINLNQNGWQMYSQSCVLDSCLFTGSVSNYAWMDSYDPYTEPKRIKYNVLSNNTFNVTVSNQTGDMQVFRIGGMINNLFYNNTVNTTKTTAGTGYFFVGELYYSTFNQFYKNTFNQYFTAMTAATHMVWSMRDSSHHNRYVGNIWNTTGGASISNSTVHGGRTEYNGVNTNNYWGNNTIKVQNPVSGLGALVALDGSVRDTFEYNVIISGSSVPAMMINARLNGSVFRHNTFYTTGSIAFDGTSGTTSNNPKFASNIFYGAGTNSSGSENLRVLSGAKLDSVGLFFSRGTPGRAILYGGVAGAPGSGGNFGLASQSVWGSPRFADSTFATFDPRVASPGLAVGSNWTDGFAGAISPGGSGSDVTPPSTVSDLSVTQVDSTSIVLNWTAPGDDAMNGIATTYDLRWSNAPITSGNFSGATPVSAQPVPIVGGSLQSYVALGLTRGLTYYFALRTRDEAGNWSGVSNGASGMTLGPDVTPPGPVNDLTASP